MSTAEIFSYIVTLVGCFGFWLGGKKIWWSWYVNIANQVAWVAFALITGYEAFLIGTAFYSITFIRNAYLWTKEHLDSKFDQMDWCTGSWDGIHNRVHPRCTIPGVPHQPHSVDPEDARLEEFDVGRNRSAPMLFDTDMPAWDPPKLDSFVHPLVPKFEPEPDLRGVLCTGRPRHKDCEMPVLAHKPHILIPKG